MMDKKGFRITIGLLIIFSFLMPSSFSGEPYNYYNQYKGSEEERRKGTSYYYTEESGRAREGRQQAGANYYYPEQYDKSQSNEVRAGTDYYYDVNDGEFKEDAEPLKIRKYYQDLNKDGISDVFTMCLGNICYDYNQMGKLMQIREVTGDSPEEDKQVELEK